MTMYWFGESWGAAFNEEVPRMDVPFGAVCIWCDELIDTDDSGVQYVNGPVAHVECFMRQTVGGLNHQRGTCSCQGGPDDPDAPGLSKREAAREAWEHFRAHGGSG